ncbi:hypothetical protein FNV43_RR10024 [Rhamnella rubrinervis]|uniref:Uncharacterized protein n=1 Tax=Rhamnella rubrinervis TaxID=2594499 RepID=A0A8K0HB04_9ROSA|nr:hypothetical protein FNV43_RR10024 [Rhamnella rubrinervis]
MFSKVALGFCTGVPTSRGFLSRRWGNEDEDIQGRRGHKEEKKDKRCEGGGAAFRTKKAERPTLTVVVEPSSLPIAIPSSDSPLRADAPPAKTGQRKATPSMLGLDDSSTIRSDSSMVGPIVDSLMTRHNRSLLREMTLDEVGLEAEQNALKVGRALKKAEAYINAMVANKTLEENSLALKQTAMEATKRAEQLERKWSEADQKLIEKDRELEALRLDYAQVAGERDALQARVARWPRAKKHIYKKAALDAILKNTNDMIRAFKAGQTEDWVTPDPSDEGEDGQEDMEITSDEDGPDDGDAPPVNQPEAPRLYAEPNQATSNDSFEEAMRLPSNEESGPGQISHAADADVGAQN